MPGRAVVPSASEAAIQGVIARSTTQGERIVSVAMSPTRHSAVMLGRDGSGYVSEMAITVVYAAGRPA